MMVSNYELFDIKQLVIAKCGKNKTYDHRSLPQLTRYATRTAAPRRKYGSAGIDWFPSNRQARKRAVAGSPHKCRDVVPDLRLRLSASAGFKTTGGI